MPAYTVSQLQSILGTGSTRYTAPNVTFVQALTQVLPRLCEMGFWRDMTYEESFDASLGYVTLPLDTDTVLACTVNNRPRPVRSMWHDVRITGRSAQVSAYYGAIDAGYYPVITDMVDLQDVDTEGDTAAFTTFNAFNAGTDTATTVAAFQGVVTIRLKGLDEDSPDATMTQSASGNLTFTVTSGRYKVQSITYDNVNVPIDIKLDGFEDAGLIATVPKGSGVLRFRRFRTSEKSSESVAHFLLKRTCPSHLCDDTIIHLGNLGAIKRGLLALIAEDNSDLDTADRHWGMAGKLLDVELSSITGAAKPTLRLDLSGGGSAAPIHNLY